MQQNSKSMKKILLLITVTILLIGCGRKHIYHTYYKDIDIDTMSIAIYDEDGSYCYQVHTIIKDSFKRGDGTLYPNCPENIYFNPQKEVYYLGFPDNEGREVIIDYNPYEN